MSNISEVAAAISSQPAPVIFLDTCALLDIVRAPSLRQSKDITAAEVLVEFASRSPPRVHLLKAHIVTDEWSHGLLDAKRSAKEVVGHFLKLDAAATEAGLEGFPFRPDWDALLDHLEQVSRALLNSCRSIAGDQESLNQAMARVVNGKRPSRGGRIKDAYIVEHCLAVVRKLRAAAFAPPCCFVSSNVKDFAAEAKAAIHPDLKADFDSVRLQYSVTVGSAVGWLRGAGLLQEPH